MRYYKFLGHDISCGACMEIGFTGTTLASHTCAALQNEERAALQNEERAITALEKLAAHHGEIAMGLGMQLEILRRIADVLEKLEVYEKE